MTTPSPSTAGEAAISAVPAKRGRGRPPGSKTKKISVWFRYCSRSFICLVSSLSWNLVLLDGEADGYINVAGLLTAATDVQVIVGSFNTHKILTLKSAMSVGTLSPPD
ncbi:uncharacterized protein [Solanum lycopersicum]|uniref:uncharacterized protein n=1 Tax=Solanum lycopersicum TaxID=4081 RepID=UPI000E1CDA15|nr:uncharacterized protein LOC101266381 [Solanum lycopersicum]